MNETHVTVVGNAVVDPVMRFTKNGVTVTNFRVASSSRRFDRDAGEWRDVDSLYLGVNCWRTLGENVVESVRKGDAVVVTGRLVQRDYLTEEGDKRTSFEVDAISVGPDLTRGRARLVKPLREPATAPAGVDPETGEVDPDVVPDDAAELDDLPEQVSANAA